MFALPWSVNNFLCNSALTILRRHYVRRARPAINAGIANQLQMLDDPENVDIEDTDLDFQNYESDFSTVGQSYTDFEKDFLKHKEKERHLIVKRKYFKEKNYNFLTWSEKEQIKYLHQSDPVQYSVERLAELFPASTEIISRILKTAWKIKNPNRILRHDKTVENNWSLLRKGEIDLEQEYKNHLLKFSSREKLVLNEDKYFPKENFQEGKHGFKPSTTEFSSIIQSYNENKNKEDFQNNNNKDNKGSIETHKPLGDTYILPTDTVDKMTSKHLSYSSFKQKAQLQNNNCDEKQKSFEIDVKAKKVANIEEGNPVPLFGHSFHKHEASKQIDPKRQIANFIRIPKKLWKSGQTYKVDDCFYDDDGKFLYRVPGLTINKS